MLVYFKETQTPQDKWDVGPGKWANSEEAKAKGAVPGQAPRRPSLAPPVPPTDRAATTALAALAADVDRARSPLPPSQVHFFPCIASAAQLKEQFEARGCAKL